MSLHGIWDLGHNIWFDHWFLILSQFEFNISKTKIPKNKFLFNVKSTLWYAFYIIRVQPSHIHKQITKKSKSNQLVSFLKLSQILFQVWIAIYSSCFKLHHYHLIQGLWKISWNVWTINSWGDVIVNFYEVIVLTTHYPRWQRRGHCHLVALVLYVSINDEK